MRHGALFGAGRRVGEQDDNLEMSLLFAKPKAAELPQIKDKALVTKLTGG